MQNADIAFLNTVWNYIKQHSTSPDFGVQQLAAFVKLGRVQLNRRLQQLTGRSPGDIIIQYRMQLAAQMLAGSNDSVKEIAWACGYIRQGNFCRAFYKEQGCSPTEYRMRSRGEAVTQIIQWKVPLDERDILQLRTLAAANPWLAQLLKLVATHIGDKLLTAEQLATTLCMSPGSLNRKTRELFGVSLQRFVKDIRLQYASELLTEGKCSVTDAAYSTGFFDPAHLVRSFKASFGCTPASYRQGSGVGSLQRMLMNQIDK